MGGLVAHMMLLAVVHILYNFATYSNYQLMGGAGSLHDAVRCSSYVAPCFSD